MMRWEKESIVERGVWLEAGKRGLIGFELPEEFGGGGVANFRYGSVLLEEVNVSESVVSVTIGMVGGLAEASTWPHAA